MFPSLKSQMAIAAGGYLLLCSLLMGQVNTATILGSVTDASGAAIPGATIKVLNVGTQAAVSANSDTSGAYTMERLPVGEYTLTVKAHPQRMEGILSRDLVFTRETFSYPYC